MKFSLRFKSVILVLAAVILGYGFFSLFHAKYDVFPEFAPPQVSILTESPGLSPEQIETLITQPVENAIQGVPGIVSLRSYSILGLSNITVNFDPSNNIYLCRQLISERLGSIGQQLPAGTHAPEITPLTSSTSIALELGLTSDKLSLMDIKDAADWTVKPRILAVQGVAGVAVFCRDAKEFQVQVNPDRLIKYNLSITDVLSAAKNSSTVRGAGYISGKNQNIVLFTEGQSLTAKQLAETVVIHSNEANILLGDVADVAEAPKPPIGAALVMGHPGAILIVFAQYGANTMEVTRRLDQAIAELKPTLKKQQITLYPDLFRPADFIQTALGNVKNSLLIGAVLVILVLFLFLFNLRTAIISCAAIPLSLLAGAGVLQILGYSLNVMTLGGLAIAIGEVVDDAVIDVENIFRKLKANRLLKKPRPIFNVVLEASLEVRSAVIYATFAVALVFVPILTISGLAGRLFAPLGIAYLSAIFASLFTALVITPALCYVLLGKKTLPAEESPVVQRLKKTYRNILIYVENHQKFVIAALLVSIISVITIIPFFEGDFLPKLREGNFVLHVSEIPGTSVDESLRIGKRITHDLLKIPDIKSICQRAGRAEEVSEDIWGTHYSEFIVKLKPDSGKKAEKVQSDIAGILSGYPGINFSINTFLSERIEETVSGYTAPVVINVFGNDLEVLDNRAKEIAGILEDIPGATGVQMQASPGIPQLMIKLEKSHLERWGFTPAEVLDAVSTAYRGTIVGQVYMENKAYNLTVILSPGSRKKITEVGMLPLRNSDGTYVQLRELADIHETSGRFAIMHDGGRRVQTVTCNITGRSLDSFVKEARQRVLSQVIMPPGTYISFAGTEQARYQTFLDLLINSLLAVTGIIILLFMVTKNINNVLLILLNLPFALFGGLLIVLVTGARISLGSAVGFVTVFGITLRNSIMMISHFEHLVTVEKMRWTPGTVLKGASDRLTPILMTATVTALGLLPLALGSGTPGREIEGPMAMVILGGLITSTLLNLLILPALSLRYGRFGNSAERPH